MLFYDEPVRKRKAVSSNLKEELFQAQNGRCMYCGRKPGIDLLEMDHKNPFSKGGTDQKRNFQLLCGTCNKRKGDLTDRQFRTRFKSVGVPSRQIPPEKTIPQSRFDSIAKKTADKKATKAKAARTARQRDPFAAFFGF